MYKMENTFLKLDQYDMIVALLWNSPIHKPLSVYLSIQ